MPEQMSNSKVMKFLSIEFLAMALGVVFSVGVAYSALASDNAETKKKVNKIERQQKEATKTLNKVETDVAVIRNEQEHIKATLDRQEANQQRILILLQRNTGS